MKIWYQTFNASARIDPKWRYYEEQCARYIPKVARPDTEIHFAAVEKRAAKMTFSSYIQYLHVAQVIETAIEVERKGFDAFVLGGMRGLGYAELREAVDIPVVFIGEASYHVACLLARKFAVIHYDEWSVHTTRALINEYGMGGRCLPGVDLGYTLTDLLAVFEGQPKRIIEEIKAAARIAINQGAELLVTDFASTCIFLAEHGIREIDGVPVLDSPAAVIKVAEMEVDFRRLGMPKPRLGPQFDVSKEDILAARRVYGLE